MSKDAAGKERRLAAIMFSDICNYSRMMGENENRAFAILERHDRIVEPAIQAAGGHIIKKMGDGVLAEFHSAVASVEAALAIQQGVREHNRQVPPDEQFRVRIGVHLGDVVVAGNDILGDGVNVASRIEPLAEPGGICISQDIYNQVHNKIEMQTVSIGPQALKNITRQIEIYRILLEAVEPVGAMPAGAVAPAGPHRGSRPRPWRKAGVAAAGGLALLLVGALAVQGRRVERGVREAMQLAERGEFAALAERMTALRNVAGHRRALRRRVLATEKVALDQAHDRVKACLAARDTAGARAVMDALDRCLAPDSPLRKTYAEAQAKLGEQLDRITIEDRYLTLVGHILRKEWAACEAVIDPESRMRLGAGGIRLALGFLSGASDVMQLTPDDFRIREIAFDPDRTHAQVIAEARRQGGWRELAAAPWLKVDDAWYAVMKQHVPRAGAGDDAAGAAPARAPVAVGARGDQRWLPPRRRLPGARGRDEERRSP